MGSAASRLGLGAARFGASVDGRRPIGAAEAFAMIVLAADAGMRLIDSVPDPEACERILGQVTPAEPPFAITVGTGAVDRGPATMTRRLRTSLRRLKRERADAVLLRPASALLDDDGPGLWNALLRLKDEGTVGAVGIGACVCDDPVGLARRFRPDLMQVPLSLLDQRLLANGALDALAQMGVEVRLRSVFLHGLLFYDPSPGAAVAPLAPQVSRLRRVLAEAGADPMQAALAFALSRPEASKVVVGVGSPAELRTVLKAAAAPGPALDWQALRLEAPCIPTPQRCRAA